MSYYEWDGRGKGSVCSTLWFAVVSACIIMHWSVALAWWWGETQCLFFLLSVSLSLAFSVSGCTWERVLRAHTVTDSSDCVGKTYVLRMIPHSDLPLFSLVFIAPGFRRNWLTSL